MNNDKGVKEPAVPAESIRIVAALPPAKAGIQPQGHKAAPLDACVDAGLVRDVLATTAGSASQAEWVAQLSNGLTRLGRAGVETLLLDLTLPDGQRIAAFNRLFQTAPGALVLIHLLSVGPVDPAIRWPMFGLALSDHPYRLELTWLDSRNRLAVSSLPIPV